MTAKERAEELTETTYGEYTMNAIEETLNKLGEVKKLAENIKYLAYSMDDEGTENAFKVDETTQQAVFDLAETLSKDNHGKLIVALAARHAAKYGEDYLHEKARTWLQRHEWVRTVAIAILALIAAWSLNSCASSVKQVQADGSSTERTLIIDGATATQLIKLYGIPQIPTVNVTK
ncbi:MAG: hypothetical protein Q4C88_05855 [Akkermansia sp.]|nr:hypothetical protein [Akkermansia sp.]